METHNCERLKAHIVPLSVSSTFDVARREWDLVGVEISEEFDNCPCGQDIKEHCYIHNRLNGNSTYVGNVCINRFIQIDTGRSEEHTSELQSLMRISYAVFCLKTKNNSKYPTTTTTSHLMMIYTQTK